MIQFVVTTLPDETSAAAIVHELVDKKLAACGTLLPAARSIYRWKDSIEDTSEVVVIFKIPSKSFSVFSSALQSLHPYENPYLPFAPCHWRGLAPLIQQLLNHQRQQLLP